MSFYTEHLLLSAEAIFNFNNHQVASIFNTEKAIRGGSLIFFLTYKFKESKNIVIR